MLINVKAAALKAAIKSAALQSGKVGRVLDIMACVSIVAGDDDLVKITGTCDKAEIEETITASVMQRGACAVNATQISRIVAKAKGKVQLTLDGKDEWLTIKADGVDYTLKALPFDDFPRCDEVGATYPRKDEDGNVFDGKTLTASVDLATFCADLAKSIPFVSHEDTRYYLNGVCLDGEGGTFNMVATDGLKLTKIARPLPPDLAGMARSIIPLEVVKNIVKVLGKRTSEAIISMTDTRFQIRAEGTRIGTDLIDAKFPDYERVIPKETEKIFELGTNELSRAMDKLSRITKPTADTVLKMSFNGAKARLQMRDKQTEATAGGSIKSKARDGSHPNAAAGEAYVGFNTRHLKTIVGQFEGDTFELGYRTPAEPCTFIDTAAAERIVVLMPMRF